MYSAQRRILCSLSALMALGEAGAPGPALPAGGAGAPEGLPTDEAVVGPVAGAGDDVAGATGALAELWAGGDPKPCTVDPVVPAPNPAALPIESVLGPIVPRPETQPETPLGPPELTPGRPLEFNWL